MRLITLILLLPIFAKSQECKYDKDSYDKFLKVRKIEKEVKAVKTFNRGNGYLTLLLCNYGENTFFRFSTASYNNILTGKRDAVIFLLDNEKTIEAYPDEIYSSDYNGARYLYEGTYKFKNDSEFINLKTHLVKSVRLYYTAFTKIII